MPSAIQRPDCLALILSMILAGPAFAEGRVTVEIDLRDPETAMDQLQTLGGHLTTGDRTIDLDLTIIPVPGTPPDFAVTLTDAAGQTGPVACDESGKRLTVDGARLDFTTTGFYTHLLLSVSLPNGTTAMLGCAGRGDIPDNPVLLLSGRFAVSVLPIPTANDVLLTALP